MCKHNFRLVEVHWLDIYGDVSTWTSMADALALKPADCWTVGRLIKDAEDHIVVAGTVGADRDDDVGSPVAIPRSVIQKITDLVPCEIVDMKLQPAGRELISGEGMADGFVYSTPVREVDNG